MMYSFGNRPDFSIIDEPFYASYLHNNKIDHPGKKAILTSQSVVAEDVIESLNIQNTATSYFFIKNMAHHIHTLDLNFILPFKNIFLIRDPARILWSFNKVIKEIHLDDIGIKQEYDIYTFLKEHNQKTVIINSDELLMNPPQYLKRICEDLSIDYDERMEKWEAGPRIEDGVWANHWYKNVHKSTGFIKQKSDFKGLPNHLKKIYEEALPYYEILNKHTIKLN